VIAVVGLSDKPGRASFNVASYLKEQAYRIIPVNPAKDEIYGEKSYPGLSAISEPVDDGSLPVERAQEIAGQLKAPLINCVKINYQYEI